MPLASSQALLTENPKGVLLAGLGVRKLLPPWLWAVSSAGVSWGSHPGLEDVTTSLTFLLSDIKIGLAWW